MDRQKRYITVFHQDYYINKSFMRLRRKKRDREKITLSHIYDTTWQLFSLFDENYLTQS